MSAGIRPTAWLTVRALRSVWALPVCGALLGGRISPETMASGSRWPDSIAWCGRVPASSSYSTMPSDQTSVAVVSGLPATCSGLA